MMIVTKQNKVFWFIYTTTVNRKYVMTFYAFSFTRLIQKSCGCHPQISQLNCFALTQFLLKLAASLVLLVFIR